MVFVAIVLACLGGLMIGGFVGLLVKLGSLADELRDARGKDAHDLGTQLDGVADKLHGLRLDLTAQRRALDQLTLEIQGPPSLRRPSLAPLAPPPAAISGAPPRSAGE